VHAEKNTLGGQRLFELHESGTSVRFANTVVSTDVEAYDVVERHLCNFVQSECAGEVVAERSDKKAGIAEAYPF
jgi:hypothetical protein